MSGSRKSVMRGSRRESYAHEDKSDVTIFLREACSKVAAVLFSLFARIAWDNPMELALQPTSLTCMTAKPSGRKQERTHHPPSPNAKIKGRSCGKFVARIPSTPRIMNRSAWDRM